MIFSWKPRTGGLNAEESPWHYLHEDRMARLILIDQKETRFYRYAILYLPSARSKNMASQIESPSAIISPLRLRCMLFYPFFSLLFLFALTFLPRAFRYAVALIWLRMSFIAIGEKKEMVNIVVGIS